MTTIKKMRFRDVPQFTREASYAVDYPWTSLPELVTREREESNLDIDPDFQRGHVWNQDKQIAYLEFILKGGKSSREILLNCPRFMTGNREGPYVLVDGKQRLNAILLFLDNKIPIFDGHFFQDFSDEPDMLTARVRWCVNDLVTRKEVLQWYLDLNSGGVVHTSDEIERVRALLAQEKKR